MKTISLQIDDELYKKIELLSKKEEKTVNEIVEKLLQNYIEENLLLDKARKIIKEEESLLKKLA